VVIQIVQELMYFKVEENIVLRAIRCLYPIINKRTDILVVFYEEAL
jgi:hypothetical protein